MIYWYKNLMSYIYSWFERKINAPYILGFSRVQIACLNWDWHIQSLPIRVSLFQIIFTLDNNVYKPLFFKERKFFYISQKNSVLTSFRLSFREFMKILPNTSIYESILIKIYVNADIMNTQIFNLIKYDLNGNWRSQNVTFMFILTLTYVLIDNFLSLFSLYV